MFTPLFVLVLELSQCVPPSPLSATQRTDAFGDPLPAGALRRLGTTQMAHFNAITWVGFASDSKTLLSTAYSEYHVRWWDTTTGRETSRGQGGGMPRDSFTVSADGKRLFLLRYEKETYYHELIDAANGKELRSIVDKGVSIHTFALSPDGKSAAFEQAGQVNVCVLESGRLVLKVPLANRRTANSTYYQNPIIEQVAFSSDGKLLAIADGRRLQVWDVVKGVPLHGRAIRAVEVLERIGTKEARQLLARLAAGARGPRLTEDAGAAIARLGLSFR